MSSVIFQNHLHPTTKFILFKLDVDDDIWQDVGLGDSIGGLPPAWLADEKVCLGIKSLLELRRCEEEEICLLQERKVLVEWFAEEWSRLQKAKLNAGKQYYQTLLFNANIYVQMKISNMNWVVKALC